MLAKNIIILGLVYAIRLILPLMVIPILTRRIMAEDFGVYMYAISFAAWLSIFVEYGFNISATREIASSNSKMEILSVITGTQSAKFLLVLATLPVLLATVFIVPVFEGNMYWAITAWLLGILMALTPIYYFQGRETLKIVGVAEIIFGALTLTSVYFLIHGPEDFYRLAIIVLLARFSSTVVLSCRMYDECDVRISGIFNLKGGLTHLKNGFHLFIFQGAVSLYTSFNVVLLGFYCSPVQVGAYASAERLMRAGIGFLGQFSNAIFPRINSLKLKFPEKVKNFRLQVLGGFFLIGLLGMVLTLGFGPIIVTYMFPSMAAQVTDVLKILSLVVPAIALSNVLGFQYLLVDRHEKIFNMIIACAAIINIVMAYFLVKMYQEKGMAVSWVIIEWIIVFAIVLMIFILQRRKKAIITD